MTASCSPRTRFRTDRTLICNAILYHFQITFTCGRFNRIFIPLTLFSSRIHLSNSSLFVRATFSQKSVSSFNRPDHNDLCSQQLNVDIDDISFTSNFHLELSQSNDLLINFLVSLFTPYKNSHPFHSISEDMRQTYIVVIHDQIPQRISLTNLPLPRSRRHHRAGDFFFSRHHHRFRKLVLYLISFWGENVKNFQ